jgi:hypothetical protein
MIGVRLFKCVPDCHSLLHCVFIERIARFGHLTRETDIKKGFYQGMAEYLPDLIQFSLILSGGNDFYHELSRSQAIAQAVDSNIYFFYGLF